MICSKLDLTAKLLHRGAMHGAARLSAGWWAVFALASAALWAMRSDARPTPSGVLTARMNTLPRVTVWAWERREDAVLLLNTAKWIGQRRNTGISPLQWQKAPPPIGMTCDGWRQTGADCGQDGLVYGTG
ncbi:hypothetical protein [Edaphobacter sp.]|uniref:hypothetical protein n=1 Tax=Edaphobacter sp. TaxID=1934404 RepID=UPI002DB6C7E5|nr:hypothetical protein [Edaphobacter sp.]HEU5342491.1 hypothetical protein [Edaphobacter sp.]